MVWSTKYELRTTNLKNNFCGHDLVPLIFRIRFSVPVPFSFDLPSSDFSLRSYHFSFVCGANGALKFDFYTNLISISQLRLWKFIIIINLNFISASNTWIYYFVSSRCKFKNKTMGLASFLYQGILKRSPTMLLTALLGAVFIEEGIDYSSIYIFNWINQGVSRTLLHLF